MSSGVSAVPPLPIISQPLDISGLGLPEISGALPANTLPLELISPSSGIDQVLGLRSQFTVRIPTL
ncbi:hypothetical protein [Zhongshania sp.]|uniref:hypothetical protein n=1 Tax=Zhongshania sp. TaxID=1971902 RepID=UPI003562FEB7